MKLLFLMQDLHWMLQKMANAVDTFTTFDEQPPNRRCRRRRFAALYRGSIWLCALFSKSVARRVSRGAPELSR
jgi:hypothetical protein